MIKNISAVIIEDEIPAARLLGSMINRIRPQWDVILLAGSIEESVSWFAKNEHPDLIFLDIHLSDGNSFEFLSQAKPHSMIIFTTAYDEYAIRAFSVDSIDYILKPVDELRLADAIAKYERLHENNIQANDGYIETILDSLTRRDKPYRTRFLIAGADKFWTLQVNDIAYFYTENKITFAVTYSGKEHIIDLPLEKLSEQLDGDSFFRANRQTIINIGAINKIEPYFNGKVIVITNPASKQPITISKEKSTLFKSWLNY